MPPVNDNWANAQVITGATGSVSGTLVGSTIEAGDEETYVGSLGRSVWYVFEPDVARKITFTLESSGFNGYAEIYAAKLDGASPTFTYQDNVTSIGDGTTGPTVADADIHLPTGVNYKIYIWVSNWNLDSAEGTFDLSWTSTVPASNDEWLGATPMPEGETRVTFDPNDYTSEGAATGENSLDSYSSAWFRYDNPTADEMLVMIPKIRITDETDPHKYNYDGGNMKFSLFGDQGYTPVLVYDNNGLYALTRIGLGDDLGEDSYLASFNPTNVNIGLGALAWVSVPAQSTVWFYSTNQSGSIPPDTVATVKFYSLFGRRYIVQATDDWNDTATTSIVSGAVRETQQYVLDYSKANGVSAWPTETFYVRGAALPPPGKYMVRVRYKATSTVYWTIRRAGRIVGRYNIYDPTNYGTSYIHHWLTNYNGQDPALYQRNVFTQFTEEFRSLPYLYVTSEDLSFTVTHPDWASGNIDVDYVEFTRIGSSGGGGTYTMLDYQGVLGQELQADDAGDGYVSTDAQMPSMCITEDGHIWVLLHSVNRHTSGTPPLYNYKNYGPWLWEWDGATWTKHGGEQRYYTHADYVAASAADERWKQHSLNIATDGIDIWMAWCERVPGHAFNTKMVVKKYDVSGDSFSLVGIPFSCSLPTTRYWSEPYFSANGMVSLGVSNHAGADPSIPYVGGVTVTTPADNTNDLQVYKFVSGAWTDTSCPGASWGTELYADSYHGAGPLLYMLHADGPSQYPSVLFYRHVYWPLSDPDPELPNNTVEWMYSEYNGSSWTTLYFNPIGVIGRSLELDVQNNPYAGAGDQALGWEQSMVWDGTYVQVMLTLEEIYSDDNKTNSYAGGAYNYSDNQFDAYLNNPCVCFRLKNDASAFEYVDLGSFHDLTTGWDNNGGQLITDATGNKFYFTSARTVIGVGKYVPCLETPWTYADNAPKANAFYGTIYDSFTVARFGDTLYCCVIWLDWGLNQSKIAVFSWIPSAAYPCPSGSISGIVSMRWRRSKQH